MKRRMKGKGKVFPLL